ALGVDRASAQEALADAGRTVSTLDEITAELLVSESQQPEDTILEAERTGFLRSAVDVLPEKMRHIVTAIYFDDKTVKEIAEELDITHSAVSQQRSEAIRLLRDGMNTHFADDDSTHEPESRISAASRNAYLARLAAQAATGMSGMVGQSRLLDQHAAS